MSGTEVTFLIKGKLGEWRVLNRRTTTDSAGVFQACRPAYDLGQHMIIRVRGAQGASAEQPVTLSTTLTAVRISMGASQ
jgi:hypothetical protein